MKTSPTVAAVVERAGGELSWLPARESCSLGDGVLELPLR